MSLNKIESIIGNLNEIMCLFLRTIIVNNKTTSTPNTDPIIIPNVVPSLFFGFGFKSFAFVDVVVDVETPGGWSVFLLTVVSVLVLDEDWIEFIEVDWVLEIVIIEVVDEELAVVTVVVSFKTKN